MHISPTLSPISRSFNVAILQIASRLFPTGFDVTGTAPDTLATLTDHIARTGRMLVWSGGSDRTSFACPEVNYAFRAWHDWCHWKGRYDFTPEGEAAAMGMQADHLRALYGEEGSAEFIRLLEIEIMGQLAYCEGSGGHFPEDQHGFTQTMTILMDGWRSAWRLDRAAFDLGHRAAFHTT